ncbi:hypothetical protein BCD64_15050 [Nostoc sp. MBR 210]|nr:hypothetical protein BCD64_15050 [Nostoc sp. MBR 210]
MDFRFCEKLRGRVSRLEQTFQDGFWIGELLKGELQQSMCRNHFSNWYYAVKEKIRGLGKSEGVLGFQDFAVR